MGSSDLFTKERAAARLELNGQQLLEGDHASFGSHLRE
jgi:hypothetical protein